MLAVAGRLSRIRSLPMIPQETERLDSWKQIAAYLNKSERTVRRWHEVEGLPVHKHQHQQRGSVPLMPIRRKQPIAVRLTLRGFF